MDVDRHPVEVAERRDRARLAVGEERGELRLARQPRLAAEGRAKLVQLHPVGRGQHDHDQPLPRAHHHRLGHQVARHVLLGGDLLRGEGRAVVLRGEGRAVRPQIGRDALPAGGRGHGRPLARSARPPGLAATVVREAIVAPL